MFDEIRQYGAPIGLSIVRNKHDAAKVEYK